MILLVHPLLLILLQKQRWLRTTTQEKDENPSAEVSPSRRHTDPLLQTVTVAFLHGNWHLMYTLET